MSFNSTGDIAVTIGKIIPSEPKFSKAANAFDINFQIKGENGESDFVRLEFSGDFAKGNLAQYTQEELTRRTLSDLGWNGEDMSELFAEQGPLTGTKAIVHFEQSKPNDQGKTFINAKYFVTSGRREPEAISVDAVKARIAAISRAKGGAASRATAAAPAASSPFGKTTAAPTAATSKAPAAKPTAASNINPFAKR